MQKLTYLLFAVVAIWQISLTSSTQRMKTGLTQGDEARRVLYGMSIAGTAGALMRRRGYALAFLLHH